MKLILNGKTISIDEPHYLDGFIGQLGLKGKFAIELNQTVIPHSEYSTTRLKSGDMIEIVQAIGGG